MNIAAQSDFDYYIDFNHTNERIYFQYVDGKYVADVEKIGSDFKIYSSQYVSGASGQDKYIFGGADGQGGITPNSEKKPSNPGANFSIEGGGIIYGATFIFDPVAISPKTICSAPTTAPTPCRAHSISPAEPPTPGTPKTSRPAPTSWATRKSRYGNIPPLLSRIWASHASS